VIARWFPGSDVLQAAGAAQQELHARASQALRDQFGRRVFVRAVLEVSNFCRENCHYCGMRRDNRALARRRENPEALAESLIQAGLKSITDINIQAGEDPVAVRSVVLPLIRILRRETQLGISVCLGTLSQELTREIREAGASTYIIKFELADPKLYDALEAPGTLKERIAYIRWLADQGWNVSSGFIAGLPGQGIDSMLQNFRLAEELPLIGCSVSPFVAGPETPLRDSAQSSIDLTLNSMASLRLMRPDWVVPAVSALNIAGPEGGYLRGLRAGANLCTINMTPQSLREDYVIYKRDRFIMTEERVLAAIDAAGMEPSTVSLAAHFESRSSKSVRA
jgi:biotin synthase